MAIALSEEIVITAIMTPTDAATVPHHAVTIADMAEAATEVTGTMEVVHSVHAKVLPAPR